jgi:hypothetical protein
MKLQNVIASAAALMSVGALSVAPMTAQAQSAYHHRQQTKNTWRNAAIGSAGLGLFGLFTHQGGLALLGAAGAAYSGSRYEHDRKSQRKIADHHASTRSRYGLRRGHH